MDHPGGISGEGALVQHGKDLVRAYHDFDGYIIWHAGAAGNGELRCSAQLLGAIFELASLRCEPTPGRF
jgi:hypothetical protein